jgi:uncharacterized membrane protein
MRQTKIASGVVTIIGALLFITSAILSGLRDTVSSEVVGELGRALGTIGLVMAIFAGLILVATVIVDLIKKETNENNKKGGE